MTHIKAFWLLGATVLLLSAIPASAQTNSGTLEKVTFILYVLDEDAAKPQWVEYDRYPTKGQAVAAARIARGTGLRAEIRERKVKVAAPKTYVLWIRDPSGQDKNWKNGGRFQSQGEAVAAERQARQSGLLTSIGESQGGRTVLPPIMAAPKKRVKLYQVVVAYPQILDGKKDPGDPWQVVYETYDPGQANDYAIRLRSQTTTATVRVASKEVLVDEDAYRRSFPASPQR
jgi:hypothetical protein